MTKSPWRSRVIRSSAVVAALGAGAVGAANVWIRVAASGRIVAAEDAPEWPVVVVLGAQVENTWPMAFLAGRLDMAAQLVHAGKARVVLVSGNGSGESGDEITAMTEYLVSKGIDRAKIVGDPLGLRTYDTFARAMHVFGIDRALVVSQGFHVPRAVALCREVGLDAIGVNGGCDCSARSLAKNRAREWLLARPKAVLDILFLDSPTVTSPPSDAVALALL
ncbi:SanA/YdcF family protein [Antrihabitans stalactiti]|uniref:SanA/YdcF family protein n=1 Tax=Antrihabitans stalactiti TaxID=2584121 RepID=UPI003B8494FF